jgi:hypothetical protein
MSLMRQMSDPTAEVPSPTPSRVWGDQWLRVSEKVLKGLNHQLTNRVASIEAVTGLIEPGETDEQLLRALAKDVARLNALMRLYRMLPAEPTALPEAVRLQDVLPQVLELHAFHADLHDITCMLTHDPDIEPVFVRPSALLRSLLVLLESAAGHILRSRLSSPILLRCSSDATSVTMVLEAPSPTTDEFFAGSGGLMNAVSSALAHAGGTVAARREMRDGTGYLRYELTLPTLTEVRRRERAAK